MILPTNSSSRLQLLLTAAPKRRLSGPGLVIASCKSGVIGTVPTLNARSPEELPACFTHIAGELDDSTQATPHVVQTGSFIVIQLRSSAMSTASVAMD
jgi:hypothetical protein